MQDEYWHQKWAKNDIGFHKAEANPLLTQHFESLNAAKGDRIFVPLCGKSLDIAWLLSNGYRVAGAELSRTAIEQLFEGLKLTPTITPARNLTLFQAENIDIFVGNLFDLSAADLRPVHCIYDRAAMVALPAEIRLKYARLLAEITGHARQLLLTYAYDQDLAKGPPFSVVDEEVRGHYEASYRLSHLAKIELPKGIKGQVDATETVWLLEPRP